jgi:hypothetical protein
MGNALDYVNFKILVSGYQMNAQLGSITGHTATRWQIIDEEAYRSSHPELAYNQDPYQDPYILQDPYVYFTYSWLYPTISVDSFSKISGRGQIFLLNKTQLGILLREQGDYRLRFQIQLYGSWNAWSNNYLFSTGTTQLVGNASIQASYTQRIVSPETETETEEPEPEILPIIESLSGSGLFGMSIEEVMTL